LFISSLRFGSSLPSSTSVEAIAAAVLRGTPSVCTPPALNLE